MFHNCLWQIESVFFLFSRKEPKLIHLLAAGEGISSAIGISTPDDQTPGLELAGPM